MRDAPVDDLLQAIHSDHLRAELFKSKLKHVNDREQMMQRNEENVLIGNGFQKYTLRNTLNLPKNLQSTTGKTL